MVNKKSGTLMIIFIILAITLTFFYFKYWHEPVATYVETENTKLAQIRKDLDKIKAELKAKGVYDCCIRNDCNWCALYMEHCLCAKLVSEKGNEKSCPECAAAWNRKQGKIPGIDPDAIEVTTFGIYGFEKGDHNLHYKGKHRH